MKVGGVMEVIVLRTMFFLISLAATVGLAQHWAGTQIGRLTGKRTGAAGPPRRPAIILR